MNPNREEEKIAGTPPPLRAGVAWQKQNEKEERRGQNALTIPTPKAGKKNRPEIFGRRNGNTGG